MKTHPPPTDIPGERWKPARRGFPAYVVSDRGRLFNVRTGRLLGPYVNAADSGSPYLRVTLAAGSYRSGPRKGQPKRSGFYVHRLVALAFVAGRSRDRWQVHHINADTLDARAVNLAFVTGAENLELRGTDPEHFDRLLADYRASTGAASARRRAPGSAATSGDGWSSELYPVEPDPF